MISTELLVWSWAFLIVYIVAMLVFGFVGQRRVRSADDFATARSSYGPLFLALAFTATTASGATFLGLPGIAYDVGLPAIWFIVLYPIGVYTGVLICLRAVSRAGESFGNRTIPEYLGDRYQSDALRIIVSLFSLILFFYLAGQLVSGLVMFERMLGLSEGWALGITSLVLMGYVFMGGAHADILTDGVQGFIMLILAVGIFALFITGFGMAGGLGGVLERIETLDPNAIGWLNPESALVGTAWAIVAIVIAHLPLGLLPHIGNKLWALRDARDRRRFISLTFVFGMTLPLIGLGGLLARAVLGDALFADGATSNEAIPALFIEVFPAWLAALLGVGILAAVMSTADGLVVSSSQIVANDLYRRTFAPRWHKHLPEEVVDRYSLVISRWATVAVMIICALMAWFLMNMNIALIVWIGIGGMMAALAGPLMLGVLWGGVTRTGAIAGFVAGGLAFLVLHAGLIPASWFVDGWLQSQGTWLVEQAPNPYSCAALGEILSVVVTVAVSKVTERLPATHIEHLFAREGGAQISSG